MSGPADALSLVLFGATGDLATGMLLPSLYALEADGELDPELHLLAVARPEMTTETFLEQAARGCRARFGALDEATWRKLAQRTRYVGGDLARPDVHCRLAEAFGEGLRRLFYLSTSPALYEPIVRGLAAAGLHRGSGVIIEKPLGRDLRSCRAINEVLAAAFPEERIYRVDHYLGKEAVQNLLALRFANVIFEPIWSKATIECVQITAAETAGVDHRREYYDDFGALRDMVQNHLLQLLCLIAMEPPASASAEAVRDEKVKVLRALRPIAAADVGRLTVRGRYSEGVLEGEAVEAYGQEDGWTETYVALCAHVDNWRWAGVPFYLRTGKRLPRRCCEIVLCFREIPHSLFPGARLEANTLVIRLQPKETISLSIMNRTTGLSADVLDARRLDLSLADASNFPRRRIAYERLLVQALRGDPTLFVRRDEVETAWAWVDTIQAGWRARGKPPASYPAGSWGPPGAHALLERRGHSWREE